MSAGGCAALIMAGGRSSRMRHGQCATHKSLRTVLGTPLIEWNLSALLWFGFRDIFVALSSCEPELAQWVRHPGMRLAEAAGAKLRVIEEETRMGTIGAVSRLPQVIDDVLVVNVDNLTDLPLTDLVNHHRACSAAATLATHLEPFRIPIGRLQVDGGWVMAYQEKPQIMVPISSGVSVFARRAIDRVTGHRAIDVPDLVQQLVAEGEAVAAYSHRSNWIDINDEAALAAGETLLSLCGDRWPGRAACRVAHASR